MSRSITTASAHKVPNCIRKWPSEHKNICFCHRLSKHAEQLYSIAMKSWVIMISSFTNFTTALPCTGTLPDYNYDENGITATFGKQHTANTFLIRNSFPVIFLFLNITQKYNHPRKITECFINVRRYYQASIAHQKERCIDSEHDWFQQHSSIVKIQKTTQILIAQIMIHKMPKSKN